MKNLSKNKLIKKWKIYILLFAIPLSRWTLTRKSGRNQLCFLHSQQQTQNYHSKSGLEERKSNEKLERENARQDVRFVFRFTWPTRRTIKTERVNRALRGYVNEFGSDVFASDGKKLPIISSRWLNRLHLRYLNLVPRYVELGSLNYKFSSFSHFNSLMIPIYLPTQVIPIKKKSIFY